MIKTVVTPAGCLHAEMTAEEEALFLETQTAAQAAAYAQQLKADAQLALDKTDLVALRCVKAGAPFPALWQGYVTALRGIMNGGAGPLPGQPAFPEGT